MVIAGDSLANGILPSAAISRTAVACAPNTMLSDGRTNRYTRNEDCWVLKLPYQFVTISFLTEGRSPDDQLCFALVTPRNRIGTNADDDDDIQILEDYCKVGLAMYFCRCEWQYLIRIPPLVAPRTAPSRQKQLTSVSSLSNRSVRVIRTRRSKRN